MGEPVGVTRVLQLQMVGRMVVEEIMRSYSRLVDGESAGMATDGEPM